LKQYSEVYSKFVKWVQEDMNKTRDLVNRKVFSLVLWCLVIPAILSLAMYGLRKFQIFIAFRYVDLVLFLPPFLFTIFYLWPTFRDLPRVFRMGGLGSLLEESSVEVRWSEDTAARMSKELPLTQGEWKVVSFHLSEQIKRMESKNRYLSSLVAVVLFFMYQFLDIGGGIEEVQETGVLGVFKTWVEQISQWGAQIFGIILFSLLFYLSGLQLQKHLVRYEGCVKRLVLGRPQEQEPELQDS
jgi:hypothetical protein